MTSFIAVNEDIHSKLQSEREHAALTAGILAATDALDLPIALQIILQSAQQATAAEGACVVFADRIREEFGPAVRVGVLADDASYSSASLEAVAQIGVRQRVRIRYLRWWRR